MKALVWPIGCFHSRTLVRLWKLDSQKEWKNTSWCLWGLRKILRVSWTGNKTIEWVVNEGGVKRELFDTVKARKLAYYRHTTRKQGSCREKEIMQGTMPGARRQGWPRTAWVDNIKMWTGLPVEESIRMTQSHRTGNKKYTCTFMVWPTLGLRTAKEQNRTGITQVIGNDTIPSIAYNFL